MTLQSAYGSLNDRVRQAATAVLRGQSWSTVELRHAAEQLLAALEALPPHEWQPRGLAGPGTGLRSGSLRAVLDVVALLAIGGEGAHARVWREHAENLARGTKRESMVQRLDPIPPWFLDAQRLRWSSELGGSTAATEQAEADFMATYADPEIRRFALA